MSDIRDRRYFHDDSWLFRALRFLNILERDRPALSISNTFMWMVLAFTAYVLVWRPFDPIAAVTALAAVLVSVGNYGYKRYAETRKADGGVAD